MNYYKAVEKKAEHGGGWAYMHLNRRASAAIYCGCGLRPDAWTARLHDTAEEAERCFYEHQLAQEVRRGRMSNLQLRCEAPNYFQGQKEGDTCGEWTQQTVSIGHLLFDGLILCERCAPPDNDEAARDIARVVHPFATGIQVMASW